MGSRPFAAFSDVPLNEAGRPILLSGEEDVISQGQVCAASLALPRRGSMRVRYQLLERHPDMLTSPVNGATLSDSIRNPCLSV